MSRLPTRHTVKIYATTLPRGWDEGKLCKGEGETKEDLERWIFTPWDGRNPNKIHLAMRDGFCRAGCPVLPQCLQFGQETKSTGIFGGEFLDEGRIVRK